jgi:hypothetical protein
MKRVFFCLLASLVLISCKRDHQNPNQYLIKVNITGLEGNPIKEAASGEMILLTSTEFSNINPNGLSPNLAQLYFDNVPVPFQQAGLNSIIVRVPVMYLADYKSLSISIRYNQINLSAIERLFYRPTVTGEVLAGHDGTFQMPAEMTIDGLGNLYVIDQRPAHDVIIKITPTGTTSLFAGGANEFGRLVGIGIDLITLRMYVSDATAQQVKYFNMSAPSTVSVLAGSGTAGNTDGTGAAASFRFGLQRVDDFGDNEKGQGLFVDLLSNIYVGEQYGTAFSGKESQIRKITAAGTVTTIPGSRITMPTGPEVLHPVSGLTLLPSTGEIVYTGGASSFYQGIARITPTGTMVRIAGKVSNENLVDGTGSSAEFAYPKAISYYGNYYHLADGSNGAYRRVTTAGNVTTLAGVGHFDTPSFCFCGITGPKDSSYVWPSIFDSNPNKFKLAARAIIMDQVGGIAVRNNNLIYLTDFGTNFKCIWRIRIE